MYYLINFECTLDNDYIVMADQDMMMESVTEHVKKHIDKENAGSLIVETYYNRKLNKGIVYCITNKYCDMIINTLSFTTGLKITDIIFHG